MSATRLFILLDIYNFDFRKRLASFGPRPVQSKRLKVKKESRAMCGATFQSLLLCLQEFCKESVSLWDIYAIQHKIILDNMTTT